MLIRGGGEARPAFLNVVPSATGELLRTAAGERPDRLRQLVERHPEHIVQHERGPLRWRQRFEDNEQGHRHRLVQRDPVRGSSTASARTSGSGSHGPYDSRRARAEVQHVQADARCHRGRPAAKVVDHRGIRLPREPGHASCTASSASPNVPSIR